MDRMTRRDVLKNAGLVTGGAALVGLSSSCSGSDKAQDNIEKNKSKSTSKKSNINERLESYPIHHAGRKMILHPELNRELHSQTAVCYLRFLRKAKVSHLELPVTKGVHAGRWIPNVPTHPAHVIVSVLDRDKNRWMPIQSVDLPPNPKFAGAGLSQAMPMEEMEAFFKNAVAEQPPHRIELGGIETDCLRVECDREHPVWPNHGECNGGPYNVPFGTFAKLSAFGKQLETPTAPAYRHKLERGRFAPSAPEGMTLETRNPLEIVFRGSRIAVGFSLIRPMLTHLNWDYFGGDQLNGYVALQQGVPGAIDHTHSAPA